MKRDGVISTYLCAYLFLLHVMVGKSFPSGTLSSLIDGEFVSCENSVRKLWQSKKDEVVPLCNLVVTPEILKNKNVQQFAFNAVLCTALLEASDKLCSHDIIKLNENDILRAFNPLSFCDDMGKVVRNVTHENAEWFPLFSAAMKNETQCKKVCISDTVNPLCGLILSFYHATNGINLTEATSKRKPSKEDTMPAAVKSSPGNDKLPESSFANVDPNVADIKKNLGNINHHSVSKDSKTGNASIHETNTQGIPNITNPVSGEFKQASIANDSSSANNYSMVGNNESESPTMKPERKQNETSPRVQVTTNLTASYSDVNKHMPALTTTTTTSKVIVSPNAQLPSERELMPGKDNPSTQTQKSENALSARVSPSNSVEKQFNTYPGNSDTEADNPISKDPHMDITVENTDVSYQHDKNVGQNDVISQKKIVGTDDQDSKVSVEHVKDDQTQGTIGSDPGPDINADEDDDEEEEEAIEEKGNTSPNNADYGDSFSDDAHLVGNTIPEKVRQNDIEMGVVARDRFVEAEDSHFFAYFMTMIVLCIIGYLIFHNKQKILALALEGRARRGTRRRPNTSGYRKLDSNLEEAITSGCSGTSVTHVIY